MDRSSSASRSKSRPLRTAGPSQSAGARAGRRCSSGPTRPSGPSQADARGRPSHRLHPWRHHRRPPLRPSRRARSIPWPLGRMRNTGRTTLRFSGGQVELVAHNDDSHIPVDLRQAYEPRPDQVVVHLTSVSGDDGTGSAATTDFNSAIKSARNAGAGGVVSVSGTSHQIAELAQSTSGASTRDFRFVAPLEGRSSKLLISENHQMLLDYGLPIMQI